MSNNVITIRGVVIPVDWDEKGSAIAVAVATHNEEEYFINPDERSEELFSLLREEVEISGQYRKKRGKKTISVTSCKLITHRGKT